jgi:two-component system phosphate regulon sensor histidine kinase PhoR
MTATILVVIVAASVLYWQKRQHQKELAAYSKQLSSALPTKSADEARIQTLLDAMLEGVIVLDSQLRIKRVNASLKEMFQCMEDVSGRTLMEALRQHQLQEMASRAQNEGQFFGGEMRLTSLNSVERIYTINGARIGPQEGVVLICHDVTALKQLERSRTEFIGNVSHELRTPLSIIRGYAETLSVPPITESETLKFASIIEHHAIRLNALVEDLITISGLECGQLHLYKQITPIGPLAKAVIAELAPKAQARKVSLSVDIPEDFTREVDSGRLRQVFTNLVDNAIKYSGSPGRVRVVAQGKAICVIDDGPGIPLEARERIFERFYRLDKDRSRNTGGTGLGLAIVKHILLAHGGTIRVEENQPHGANFIIELPAT